MDSKEQEDLLHEIETELDRLHAMYNQYFMGIEKLEPMVLRKRLDRKIYALRKDKIRNTALRFRFNRQIQKYGTQSSYWARICRQIEEGTYIRDINRANRRRKAQEEQEIASDALNTLSENDGPIEIPSYEIDDTEFIDDPFSESKTSFPVKKADTVFEEVDDPFSTRPVSTPKSKTAVGRTLKNTSDSGFEEIDEDLTNFFSKKSVPPPPPERPASLPVPQSRPPLQANPTANANRPRAVRQPKPSMQPMPPTSQKKQRDVTLPQPSKAAPRQKISNERLKSVYKAYLTARKRTNEPTNNLSFEKIASKLRAQVEQKSDVSDFKVIIRGGKAVIKTVKKLSEP